MPTALITGSTSGIGKATARALAAKGYEVILHGRRRESCEATATEIRKTVAGARIEWLTADLADLGQVREMAAEVRERFPALSVLVLNAGTFSHSRRLTPQSYEHTFAVNYLSRFLLVRELLDLLKANGPSRIVDVSGAYHAKGRIHFEDLSLEKNYSMATANNQSKLANVLWTCKLARQLGDAPVTVNTLHPGAVNTGSVLRSEGFSAFFKFLYRIMSVFFKSPEKGADTSVYLASSDEVKGLTGKYFVGRSPRKSSQASLNTALQDRLWELSEALIR